MCKIHPENESLVVQASRENKSDAFWMKVFGFVAMPCCCIGLSCFGVSSISQAFAERYANIVKFYGGENNCNVIKNKIDKEIDIFNRSIIEVRCLNNPNLHIDPNITLLDIIKTSNTHLDNIIRQVCFTRYITNKDYSVAVWNKYVELGGNSNVVIYGLIEYLLTFNSSTSRMMEDFLNKLTSNTSLRVEILIAKHKAIN